LAETKLIELVWSTKEDGIDFNIPSANAHIIKRNKAEVLGILQMLQDRLVNGEYPFAD
jgi:hypothetical protein